MFVTLLGYVHDITVIFVTSLRYVCDIIVICVCFTYVSVYVCFTYVSVYVDIIYNTYDTCWLRIKPQLRVINKSSANLLHMHREYRLLYDKNNNLRMCSK